MLTKYQSQPDSPKIQQVKGWLEAFYHPCELAAWDKATKIITPPFHTLIGCLRSIKCYVEQSDSQVKQLGVVPQILDSSLRYAALSITRATLKTPSNTILDFRFPILDCRMLD
jgi:hypothetical protein